MTQRDLIVSQRASCKTWAWVTGIVGILLWPLWIATGICIWQMMKADRELLALEERSND